MKQCSLGSRAGRVVLRVRDVAARPSSRLIPSLPRLSSPPARSRIRTSGRQDDPIQPIDAVAVASIYVQVASVVVVWTSVAFV